ncbi:hypothetical protein CYMTET_7693 [Cymbomonas tetramitiformis]|uniref:RRM domain-containing protein n=1 Tax=Cymbomonas tetramitiformis TaxID=36881 RepID=A0AAE0LGR4_9CHLO|nr:hypothetical protein CYMTET_7693 [Cymbomonas tetramitiformis]
MVRYTQAEPGRLWYITNKYHPFQAGSIDGIDTRPHDRGVTRAVANAERGRFDEEQNHGDPYATLFVARLSPATVDADLRSVFEKYGALKKVEIVRDVVTGESRGYAFVEFEKRSSMKTAFKASESLVVHDKPLLVDYARTGVVEGWIPRRFGGGLGGRKESGQLRFGGRDRPLKAPLKPVPVEELRRLDIPLPPSQFQDRRSGPPIPSPPPSPSRCATTCCYPLQHPHI